MEFLGTTIKKVSDYYQKGVMITGKEKIFSGKEVSDEERISLAGNLLGKHIQEAYNNGAGIVDGIKQGLAGFVTDMVVNTPVNAVKDAASVAEYTINQAIKAYANAVIKTEGGYKIGNEILKNVTLPFEKIKEGADRYERIMNLFTEKTGETMGYVAKGVFQWVNEAIEKLLGSSKELQNPKEMSEPKLIKTIEEFADKKELSQAEKEYVEKVISEYQKNLEYRSSFEAIDDEKKFLLNLTKDTIDLILSNSPVKGIYSKVKLVNYALHGDFDKVLIGLQPSQLLKWANKVATYTQTYGDVVFKTLAVWAGNIRGDYDNFITEYSLHQKQGIEMVKNYDNLPGIGIIKADILYYQQYGKHIPNIQLSDEIRNLIEEENRR